MPCFVTSQRSGGSGEKVGKGPREQERGRNVPQPMPKFAASIESHSCPNPIAKSQV